MSSNHSRSLRSLALLLLVFAIARAAAGVDAKSADEASKLSRRSLLILEAETGEDEKEDKKLLDKWSSKVDEMKKDYDDLWKGDYLKFDKLDKKETIKYDDWYAGDIDEEYKHCVKKAHYQCNSFLPMYGPCFMKYWTVCIAEEMYEKKENEKENKKEAKADGK